MSASSSRSRLLRYAADLRPVTVVLASFALHVAIYLWAPLWLALVLMPLVVAVSTVVAAFNHHHQHVNVFRSRLLNRAYDVILAVQSAGPSVTHALEVVSDLTKLVLALLGLGALVVFVLFLLKPRNKRRSLASTSAQFAAALGGTREARMEA